MTLFAEVVFPLPLDQTFPYSSRRSAARAAPGPRVRAPLGTRTVVGFVVRIHDQAPTAEAKSILEAVDPEPIIPADILDLTARLSRRFLSSQGEMLRTAVPPSLSRRPPRRFRLTEAGRDALAGGKLRAAEARLAEVLKDAPAKAAYSLTYLKRKAEVADASAVASRLIKKGWAEEASARARPRRPPPRAPRKAGPKSEPGRAEAALQLDLDFRIDEPTASAIRLLTADLAQPGFAPFLLVGPADRRAAAILAVCGEVLSGGRSVLVLFPEIGMSRAVEQAFAARLGERVVLLHGRMSEPAREQARRRIAGGTPLVVAGPQVGRLHPDPRLGPDRSRRGGGRVLSSGGEPGLRRPNRGLDARGSVRRPTDPVG